MSENEEPLRARIGQRVGNFLTICGDYVLISLAIALFTLFLFCLSALMLVFFLCSGDGPYVSGVGDFLNRFSGWKKLLVALPVIPLAIVLYPVFVVAVIVLSIIGGVYATCFFFDKIKCTVTQHLIFYRGSICY